MPTGHLSALPGHERGGLRARRSLQATCSGSCGSAGTRRHASCPASCCFPPLLPPCSPTAQAGSGGVGGGASGEPQKLRCRQGRARLKPTPARDCGLCGVWTEGALARLSCLLLPTPPGPRPGEGGGVLGTFPLLCGSPELTQIKIGTCYSVCWGGSKGHPLRPGVGRQKRLVSKASRAPSCAAPGLSGAADLGQKTLAGLSTSGRNGSSSPGKESASW